MANTYRMTDRDIKLMIQLRATNAAIFTGRRNSAMRGWRAIRKEMGLQGMLSARQLKKKWNNLKEKYKTLKNPPEGMETLIQPSSWRWYHLMDEALGGRLTGTAAVVQPSPLDEDEEHNVALPALILPDTGRDLSGLSVVETLGGVLGAVSRTESPTEAGEDVMETQPVISKDQCAELYVTLLPECTVETNKTPSSSSRNILGEAAEVDVKLVELQRERRALEREQEEFDRELICLERDRELLDRDTVALERDRAAVERDRVILDRDRAFLDRDRAFLERDRAFLERAREDLEKERALWRGETDGAAVDRDQAERRTEKEVVLQTRVYRSLMAADLDPDQLETRRRLVSLFQKLVEKL